MAHAYVHMHTVAPPQGLTQSRGTSLHPTVILNRRCLLMQQQYTRRRWPFMAWPCTNYSLY